MFARISGRYDRLNTIMTAGRHYAWRRMAVESATAGLTGPALDVATGTGDFAVELARAPGVTAVVGIDFTLDMLTLAQEKARKKRVDSRVAFLAGDAHALPFADNIFACATVGFGVRNFIDLPAALSELVRVVRPGGRIAVLEIVRPGSGPLGRLFPLYFRHVTPWLGAAFAGDRKAYTYLPESVSAFMTAAEVASLMEGAGLTHIASRRLALSTVALLIGEKPITS